jgi:hypothetical protein
MEWSITVTDLQLELRAIQLAKEADLGHNWGANRCLSCGLDANAMGTNELEGDCLAALVELLVGAMREAASGK